jgi:hypothetical protein
MRHLSTLGLIALNSLSSLFVAPATAQIFDMSTMTCKDFMQGSPGNNSSYVVMWWQGYYARKSGADLVINFNTFIKNAESLDNYCRANPAVKLTAAADKILGE